MNTTLLQIQIFVAVYEARSFTAAAARECIAQSGISLHIRQLEEQLGVQLLTRQRTIVPTPAGHEFYRHCIDLLRAHARTTHALNHSTQTLSGPVRAGIIQSVSRSVLSRAVVLFERIYPRVTLHVTEAHASVITQAVRGGEFDFGIVPFAVDDLHGLRTSPFCRSPAFLVSSPDSPLEHGAPVRLADLDELYLLRPNSGNVLGLMLERYLLDNNVRVTARMSRFESMLGAMDLVRTSHWSLIMPGLFVAPDLRRPNFTLNPLADPVLWEEIVVVEPERQPLHAAGQAFVDILRGVANDVNDLPIRVAAGQPLHQALAAP